MVDPLDTQTKKKSRSKAFWVLAIALPVLLFSGVHFFIARQVRKILPNLVESLTDGQYSFSYTKLSFDYFSPFLRLTSAELHPLGKDLDEEYHVKVDSLYLSIESLLPLFLNDAVKVNEIRLVSPSVLVKRNKERQEQNGGDLHEQVSRMQDNTMKFLNALSVVRCSLTNGSFRYYPNPGRPGHFNIEHVDLDIRDLVIPRFSAEKKEEITAWINVSIKEPSLRIPDSLIKLEVDHFEWDNRKAMVELGEFTISQRSSPPVSDSFRISLGQIGIRRIDWAAWLDSGIIRLDTLIARDGSMYFESSAGKAEKKVMRDTVDLKKLKFWDAIGDLEIGHFAARYINAAMLNRYPGEERSNSLVGDSLVVQDMSVRTNRRSPLRVGELGLGVREFVNRGRDNKFQSSFSRLRVKDRTIVLNNYLIQATRKSRFGEGSRLLIPELTMEGVSLQEVFDKKASIRTIRMASPDFLIYTDGSSNARRQFSLEGLEEIRPFIDVERLVVDNAQVMIRNRRDTSLRFGTRQFSAVILARAALRADNVENLLSALTDVKMKQVFYMNPRTELDLQDGMLDYGRKTLFFGRVQGHLNNGKIHADLSNVLMVGSEDVRPFGDDVKWHFRKIDVGSGQLEINTDDAGRTDSVQERSELLGHVDSLSLYNLVVKYRSPKLTGGTMINRMKVAGHHLYTDSYNWESLQGELDEIRAEGEGFRLRSSGAELRSHQRSVLANLELELNRAGTEISVLSPQLSFTGSFPNVDARRLELEELALAQPRIRIALNDSAAEREEQDNGPGYLHIDRFRLENPSLTLAMQGRNEETEILTSGDHIRGGTLVWNRNGGRSELSFRDLLIELDTVRMFNSREEIMRAGSISAAIPSFSKQTGSHPLISIGHFDVHSIDAGRIRGTDTMEVRTAGVRLGAIRGLVLQKDSILQAAMKLPPVTVLPGTVRFNTSAKQVSIVNLKVNTEEEYLEWDSLALVNRRERDLYFALQQYEKDYFTLHTGRVRADDLKPVIYGGDTTVYIRKLTIDPLNLTVERDKRVPDDTVTYRPLFARMARKIKFPIKVDSVELARSTIWHNVIDEKTEKEGTIFFTGVSGHVLNVKNFDYGLQDSIRISVSARLMGEGRMRFRFRETYQGEAQGFVMGVQMGGMEMEELNRLIVALNNVRIERGTISNLIMRVRGNDSLAIGSMDIKYKDLKVSVLNEENKRRGLSSWLANIFVRGKNNKAGIIYSERLKEKSVFNFWSRIALAGLMTNLGVRKNGRQIRKIYRKLGKDQLPPELF